MFICFSRENEGREEEISDFIVWFLIYCIIAVSNKVYITQQLWEGVQNMSQVMFKILRFENLRMLIILKNTYFNMLGGFFHF